MSVEGLCHRSRMEAVALHRSAIRTHGQLLSSTESIPPTPPHLERRRLRGVEHIEPNDEIGQRPAVLSLPSLAAIGWIILKRFGRSGPRLEKMRWMRRAGNWVVITPNSPSCAPHFNSCGAGSVDEHINDHGARTSSWWSASQCRTSSRQ